ncbi:jg3828 [Pararge aegeria aegeria]|uniref:Jg3828 protein n=1 Tax=Pararge aegeria aegeria TaxID=348720 RepID=A0A8S4RKY9_9NEOP|nr:jg3828 [Pararge aegeria aegeria]
MHAACIEALAHNRETTSTPGANMAGSAKLRVDSSVVESYIFAPFDPDPWMPWGNDLKVAKMMQVRDSTSRLNTSSDNRKFRLSSQRKSFIVTFKIKNLRFKYNISLGKKPQ